MHALAGPKQVWARVRRRESVHDEFSSVSLMGRRCADQNGSIPRRFEIFSLLVLRRDKL